MEECGERVVDPRPKTPELLKPDLLLSKAFFRQIVTESFIETFGLMTQIAFIAETQDHHPEWSNVYNRLDIWLTTHDAGGVSQRDIILAREIDRLASQ